MAAVMDSVDVDVDQIMPAVPHAPAGRLALVTAAADEQYRVEGVWEVWGGYCGELSVIQLVARAPGVGTALLLALPDSGPAKGSYPIVDADKGDPEPRTARFALQVYGTDRAYVLRAIRGEVELDSALATATGHLTAILAERTFRDTIRVAAAFWRVPVPPLGPTECQLLQDDSGVVGASARR